MAIPAILQQLGRNNMLQTAGKIKQMMQTVRMAQNPQAALNAMAMNNPQLAQVMEIVNQHGGDPMRAFHEVARENGMDPDEILGMLK